MDRQPLTAKGIGKWIRSWWWSPGGRHKKEAKRRSARRERPKGKRDIEKF